MALKTFVTSLFAATFGGAAFAQNLEVIGQPVQGKMGWQPAATELARDIHWLDSMLLIIITAISLFVVALLAGNAVVIKPGNKPGSKPQVSANNARA